MIQNLVKRLRDSAELAKTQGWDGDDHDLSEAADKIESMRLALKEREDSYIRLADALDVAERVCEAAATLRESMHDPQAPTMHSDVYSLRNWDVVELTKALATWRAAQGVTQ